MSICVHCGLSEDEHCRFEAVVRPSPECCCDVKEWGNPQKIPPVCSEWIGENDENCNVCEHDRECHAPTPEPR